jgi:multicomponent K+:H+ antiporter subunit E
MKRLIPYPLLASALFVLWILLTGFSVGHILLGGVIAIAVSRTMLLLRPEQPNIKLTSAIPKLFGLVLADIVRSNIKTARIILFGKADRKAGFLDMPIRIRSPYALATLSIMCTATPGTLWVQHDPSRRVILIHFLDMADAEAWVDEYNEVYEPLLMEIYE